MLIDPRLGWAGVKRQDADPDPFVEDQLAVWSDAGRHFFTMQEWVILKMLRANRDKFVPIERLESWVYAGRQEHGNGYNVIPVHICRIRKKLKGSGYVIRSHIGAGYMLERE